MFFSYDATAVPKHPITLPYTSTIEPSKNTFVNLLPVCYWHELLDLVYFYKATHNMIHLDPSVVPFVTRTLQGASKVFA